MKLEFFTKTHRSGKASEARLTVPTNRVIGDFLKANATGELAFDSNTRVMDLEEMFLHHCGLFVQVFRKSGRVWLETTITDDWTLAQQNQQGQELEGGHEERP